MNNNNIHLHLRRLKSVRRILGAEVTSGLVSTFVTTSLTTVTQSSQAFHNLRLVHFNVFRMRRPDLLQEQERGITSLQSSRAYTGFPIKFSIVYKLCVLMHLVRVGRSHAYLSDMMTSVADLPGRERLRSSSNFRYELPQFETKVQRAEFFVLGPKAWNSLPSNLQELTTLILSKNF